MYGIEALDVIFSAGILAIPTQTDNGSDVLSFQYPWTPWTSKGDSIRVISLKGI